jgi:prevent-host-death family protein
VELKQPLTHRFGFDRIFRSGKIQLDFSRSNVIIIIMIIKKTDAESISTNDLRFNFSRVLESVRKGRSLTLTYRNKPLARIVPINDEPALSKDDPIYHLYELAEPMEPLTNEEIDKAIYDT